MNLLLSYNEIRTHFLNSLLLALARTLNKQAIDWVQAGHNKISMKESRKGVIAVVILILPWS